MDADHISRQTNLPPATPSERMETQEFEPTYPLPHPLDQWQHLVTKEFLVHASKVRLYKCPQWYDGHRGPILRPGELADFGDSESSVSRPPPPVRGANSAPPHPPPTWKYSARSLAPGNQLTCRPPGPPQKTPSGTPLPLTPLAPLHRQPAPPSPLAAPGPGATRGSLAGPAQPRSWTSTQPV